MLKRVTKETAKKRNNFKAEISDKQYVSYYKKVENLEKVILQKNIDIELEQ